MAVFRRKAYVYKNSENLFIVVAGGSEPYHIKLMFQFLIMEKLIRDGVTRLGGPLPINPSGGLLTKRHPLGETGVARICELFWQLRGEAKDRKVQNARIVMAHNLGGIIPELEAGAAVVHILTND